MAVNEVTPASFNDNGAATPTSTISVTRVVAAGNYIRVVATWSDPGGSPVVTCADNAGGSYPAILDQKDDAADGQSGGQFNGLTPSAGGSITFTLSTTINLSAFGICVQEINGSSGMDQHTGQVQAAPPTSADGVSSGNITPSSQPFLLLGTSIDSGGGATPAAGTGFTSSGSGWSFGIGGNLATSESERLTSTAAVAATFTTSVGDGHITWAMSFLEAASGPGILVGPVSYVTP